MRMIKRTKIVCTIGPASHTEEQLAALVEAGMNVCRLNFSHGTHEDHAELIRMIRSVAEKTGEPLTILQDLQGPKIRVAELPADGVQLEAGKEVVFTTGIATLPKIGVTYPNLHKDVKAGERLLLDDGLLSVNVLRVEGQDVVCQVIDGGRLTSHKGLNLPETKTSISALSDKDRDDVKFGVEQQVDWIALSFVRSAQDIKDLRGLIGEAPIRLMAKIEKPEAVEHMDEIIAEVDGIMVARGDLGIEIPAEKVPVIQKILIEKCLRAAKPVIVATQMLDSMIRNPRATRAEVSDIANAVIDHTDATMLSGETASGAHPLEAVQIMSATIREAEASRYDDLEAKADPENVTEEERLTNLAAMLAKPSGAKAILVATMTGQAARLVSRYRPELPIFAAVPNERVRHQLNLSWGVHAFVIPTCQTLAELLQAACTQVMQQGFLQTGDEVILVAGEPLGESGHVNLVEVRKV
ncbi:pyruvate kinase [Candidatus Uhrbacteria bacterium]|nr:pyruvate kinase [Candidatus Uhrbacteria bacterium]